MLEIVAELSANHLGNVNRAHEIVEAAAKAGADLFKVQVWEPDTMCLDTTVVVPRGPWAGRKLVDLYREAWTPWQWLPELFDHARDRGLEPFGAAFDAASVDYLDSLGVKRHKVASFELVDLPLIRHMASKGKLIILSTGMANRDERWQARAAANPCRTMMLACTSAYPASAADAGLCEWENDYEPWGLSDHTVGCGVATAAVALGARMIEKHLTLRRADGGPDSGFSMEPDEFAAMVVACRQAHDAVQPRTRPPQGEDSSLRRSLYVCRDTNGGERLVLGHNVRTARPAGGLPCGFNLGNLCARHDLSAGHPLTGDDVA